MNKTAVITGTSKGLGLALSNYLLEKGWKVFGISKTTPCILHENYTHLNVDISSYDQVKQAFEKIKSIDLLVNNAAVFTMKKFQDTDVTLIDKIIDTNLKGTIYVTKNALSSLNQNSRIIFINSVAGLNELAEQSIYCASKSGLTSFAGILGKELADRNIKITSIHPGGINTTLWNENNPYPCGNVEDAMSTEYLSKLIEFIAESPENVICKTIKLFPDIEWH